MLFDLNMFDLKDVSKYNMPVNMPNGSFVLVKFVRKSYHTSNVVLKNVLYVPYFKFNLLFASKLITENNCVVKFLSTSCVI